MRLIAVSSVFAIGSQIMGPMIALSDTVTRTCPFSCRTIGMAGSDNCHDYRHDNLCTVKVDNGSVGASSTSSSGLGGSRICLLTSGRMRVKGQCKSSAGEVELTAAKLSSLSDIAIAGVPSGETVTGVIGAGAQSDGAGRHTIDTSFGFIPVNALGSSDVVVASTSQLASECGGIASNCLSAEENSSTSICVGSTSNPTAPAGKLCIYPVSAKNANQLRAYSIPESGSLYGFSLAWNYISVGESVVEAVWAYTAQ